MDTVVRCGNFRNGREDLLLGSGCGAFYTDVETLYWVLL